MSYRMGMSLPTGHTRSLASVRKGLEPDVSPEATLLPGPFRHCDRPEQQCLGGKLLWRQHQRSEQQRRCAVERHHRRRGVAPSRNYCGWRRNGLGGQFPRQLYLRGQRCCQRFFWNISFACERVWRRRLAFGTLLPSARRQRQCLDLELRQRYDHAASRYCRAHQDAIRWPTCSSLAGPGPVARPLLRKARRGRRRKLAG